MPRRFTPFESELIDSIVWQLKGHLDQRVSLRATARILRATLRRVSAPSVGRSVRITADSPVHIDHVVPVNVLARQMIQMQSPSEAAVKALIERYLLAAEVTKEEHTVHLKRYQSQMPDGWSASSEAPDNHLARYKAVKITLVAVEPAAPTPKRAIRRPRKSGGRAGEKFPLRKFETFRTNNEAFAEEWGQIEHLLRGRTGMTDIVRGLAILILEQENLLESFIIETDWPYGRTHEGRQRIKRWRDRARAFLDGES